MLLHHRFLTFATVEPGRTALVENGSKVSYGELLGRSRAIARLLRGRGIRRGDRVALFLNNSTDFVAGLYGSLMIGAVAMPINPMTKEDKLVYLINDASASCLLTEPALARVWQSAMHRCASLGTVVSRSGQLTCEDPRHVSWPATETSTVDCPPEDSQDPAIDQDLAALIYTSGSSGFPKGVMLTHLNMVSAAHSITTYLGLLGSDVVFCALPLSFDYGLYQVLMALSIGATVVLARGFSFPIEALQQIEKNRVTIFPGVPTMFSMLLSMHSLDKFDLSSLRIITNTAAALSETHIRALRQLFPQARLFSMYGLTECKRVSYLPPEQLDIRPTSVGRGMPNEEVWLVDDTGKKLPNGSMGELVIRGSNVMRGYWNAPEETAKRLRGGPIPGELILYSGDIFRTDSEGWLYFIARKDDIIKSRGEKISPREVEDVIHALSGVRDVAVIGVPDELLGQAVKAIVELDDQSSLSARQIIDHCMTRLENFMVPKHVEFVSQLPRTENGKVQKSGLMPTGPTT